MSVVSVKWKLRALMADREMSNEELARRVNVHVNTISKWKRANEMPKISGPEIGRLCSALQCQFLDLVGEGQI